jgi:hypothetical protein
MQCLDKMGHCGGTADRLKSFVFLLRIAHESRRIFLIYWNMPARLDEFLVPPKGGIDWRVPTFMVGEVSVTGSMRFCQRCWGMLLLLSTIFLWAYTNRNEYVALLLAKILLFIYCS